MDLFEYQAKQLFAEYGVPVPKDKVASTAEEAREITTAFAAEGIPQVVVKAQVKTGGRGKAGGVKLADGPADAYEKSERIIGMDIKGHTVHRVLIAEATDIKSEYYLSFLLDRANRTFLSICSVDGGMEIEELAHTNPDAIARVPVSPLTGVDHAKALEIVRSAEGQQLRERLTHNILSLRSQLRNRGMEVYGDPSAIVAVKTGDEALARMTSRELPEIGLISNLVEFPAVGKGQARFRLQVMAGHTEEQITAAAERMGAAMEIARRRLDAGADPESMALAS